jgi:hypothetical protein
MPDDRRPEQARGVGKAFLYFGRFGSVCAYLACSISCTVAMLAVGVGNTVTVHASVLPWLSGSPHLLARGIGKRMAVSSLFPPPRLQGPPPLAIAVGHNPKPLATVRGTHVVCADAMPFRIVPVLGKLPENAAQPVGSSSDAWNVLHEDDAGSHLANDAPQLRPQVSRVGASLSLAGAAPRLTGDTAEDEIHASAPGSPVEGREVVPQGRIGDPTVSHPGLQEPLTVGVALDVADGSGEADGLEDGGADPASGADVDGVEGR